MPSSPHHTLHGAPPQGRYRLAALLACGLLGACSGMLPTSRQTVSNQWQDFDAARPPNVQILNHSQVVRAVLPSPLQELGTIPKGIIDCMKAQEACVGYFMEPSHIDRKRVGNFMLDFLNFKRDTLTTGWKFGALIVVIHDKVVYKQWSGRPKIEETEVRHNPLGPLQGVGESVRGMP